MTPLEQACFTTLTEVLHHFEKGKINRVNFQTMMGHIRDVLRRFEAARLGCCTGTHLSDCTCKPAVLGVTWQNIKRTRSRQR